jgi:hypothetical protein
VTVADIVDIAGAIEAETISLGIARAAAPLDPGTAGECEQCEWWMPRLVGGLCAFCRDRRPRPADWEPPVPPSSHHNEKPKTAEKEVSMPAKSIQISASADDVIAAIEAHARDNDVSLGLATASLIKRGMSVGAYEPGDRMAVTTPATIEDLLGQVRDLFATRDEAAVDAANTARDNAERRAEAAEQRAAAAENKLAQAKALFA